MALMQLTIDMADGTEHVVAVSNPDRVRWDMFAVKNKYPAMAEIPFIGLTYLAWAALVRTGKYGKSFDEFSMVDCTDVTHDDDDDADSEATPDPTR